MGLETIAIIGLVGAVIGGGISAYSSYEQGKVSNTIAQMNAANQERNARLQLASMQAQSNLQKQQAEANYKLRGAEAQARFNNATSMENRALSQDRVNRENARRRNDAMAREQGTQRATIAASGVVETTGTPLDLIAETAATIQRDREEQAYGQEIQRRSLFREASMERLGGQLALAGATLDRSSTLAAANLNAAAGKADYLAGLRTAQVTRLSGSAAQRAGAMQAGATLFSTLGSAAGSTYKLS